MWREKSHRGYRQIGPPFRSGVHGHGDCPIDVSSGEAILGPGNIKVATAAAGESHNRAPAAYQSAAKV
jgi:hypothetical protein